MRRMVCGRTEAGVLTRQARTLLVASKGDAPGTALSSREPIPLEHSSCSLSPVPWRFARLHMKRLLVVVSALHIVLAQAATAPKDVAPAARESKSGAPVAVSRTRAVPPASETPAY